MIGAALLAKKAVEKGLTRKPWVKTTLAPGSKVVTDYYERAGLTPYLDKLGFNLVGYGCTTCIGNSGPLIPEVSDAVNEADLAVVSVLSGNRNFEGRINPDVKMNYLASPPLVVAYALAGSMDVDLFNDPLGRTPTATTSSCGTSGRRRARSRRSSRTAITSDMFTKDYADVFAGDEHVAVAADARGRHVRVGRRLDLRPQAAVLRRHARRAGAGHRHRGRPGAAKLGDSVTTDHISPAGAIKKDSPAGQVPRRARRRAARLQLLRLASRQPRGDDPRHVRQHPAAQPARPGHRGRRSPATSPGTAT